MECSMDNDKEAIFEAYKSIITESINAEPITGVYKDLDVDGKIFGQPDKSYSIMLTMTGRKEDVSDYDREVGYGTKLQFIYDEIEQFAAIERDSNGQSSRTEQHIKQQDKALYDAIFEYAKDRLEVQE